MSSNGFSIIDLYNRVDRWKRKYRKTLFLKNAWKRKYLELKEKKNENINSRRSH